MNDTTIYSRKIVDLIDELILEGGFRSYSELPEFRRDELSFLGIRAISDPYVIITDADNEFINDIMYKVSEYANINHSDIAHDIAQALKARANKFFETVFSDLFNDRYNQITCELKSEAGLRPIIDHINGETRWVKS